MTTRDGSRRRVLSYEERVLWTAVTKSIAPMRAAEPAADPDAAATEAAEPARRAVQAPRQKAASATPSRPAPPLTPLGRRMKQRVVRGKQAIEARLDLHGLTQAQAHATLLRFLHSAQARDARLVLVVTGKGMRGEGERGVLRRQVPHWLALPEFRSVVIGFEDAHIAHGGEGALYIRLRRAREG